MEILNIEYHRCRLIVKALNTCPTRVIACKELRISDRSLYRLMATYDICKRQKDGTYFANNPPRYQIINPSEDE